MKIEISLILNQKVLKSKSKIAQAFRYALLRRHQFSRQISTRHNSCNSWEQNSKNNEKVHFHQGIRTVPWVPRRIKYFYLEVKGTNNLSTAMEKGKKIITVRQKPLHEQLVVYGQSHCPEVCAIPISVMGLLFPQRVPNIYS